MRGGWRTTRPHSFPPMAIQRSCCVARLPDQVATGGGHTQGGPRFGPCAAPLHLVDAHYNAGWFTKLTGRLGRYTRVRSSSGAAGSSSSPSWPGGYLPSGASGLRCAPQLLHLCAQVRRLAMLVGRNPHGNSGSPRYTVSLSIQPAKYATWPMRAFLPLLTIVFARSLCGGIREENRGRCRTPLELMAHILPLQGSSPHAIQTCSRDAG